MVNPQMVMYEEEFNQIQTVVDRLVRDANAKVVFIVDKNGQLIAASGEVDNIDTTSLASLTAGNIAATGGIAKLLRENEFATQFHEGEKANIHIQLVGNRVILVVIFDSKSSLGLVRLPSFSAIPVGGGTRSWGCFWHSRGSSGSGGSASLVSIWFGRSFARGSRPRRARKGSRARRSNHLSPAG